MHVEVVQDVVQITSISPRSRPTSRKRRSQGIERQSEAAAAAGYVEKKNELADLEQQVEDAFEALVTLREARAQIGALRRDSPSKGQPSGQGPDSGQVSNVSQAHEEGHLCKGSSYRSSESNVAEANIVDLMPAEVAFTKAAFNVQLK